MNVSKLSASTARVVFGLAIAQLPATSATAAVPAAASRQSVESRKAATLAGKADIAASAGETWNALALMRKAATLAPQNARYRAGLGRAYLAVKLYGSASASFGDALTLDVHDSGAREGMALAQNALGRNGAKSAVASSERAVDMRIASAQ